MKRSPIFIVLSLLASLGCAPPETDALDLVESELDGCTELTAPVYHRVNPTSGASLYTLSSTEATGAVQYGFTDDRGVAFKASASAKAGSSPVYRLFNAAKSDFLWTASDSERSSAQSAYGYVDQGVYFHATRTTGNCLVPVHRYALPAKGKHRFAVTDAQRSALVAAGWVYEGVVFYAAAATATTPPPPPPPPPPAPAGDTKFTLVVIPDTQRELWTDSDVRFRNRTEWIASNKSTLDIRFVLQTGDLVDWDTPDHSLYVRASNGLKVLDDAQMPYAIAIGNHDTAAVCPGGSACPGADTAAMLRVTTTFNQFFPTSRFRNLRGAYEAGKVDNAYHTFQAGGLDWLVINLELWPRTAVVQWAKTVLASFPKHNAIFITHSHLSAGSTIEQTNGGYGANSPQYVFDNLYKQYPNVVMIFSGHVGTTGYRKDTGVAGNSIYSFLNCYHDMETNPTRLVEIDTAAHTLSTRVYSPYTNAEKNDGSKMTLSNVQFVR
ncbi:MAG: metallophosphoesterase [Archangiaceae bacterium]|nr:metallophosphoesterase [Archangiaceae bacterium]